MKIKIRDLRYVFLVGLFFLISASFLPAQTARYFIDMDGTEPRFIQPNLSWKYDKNTPRYEVIIEEKADEKYQQVLQKFTDVSFIEVFLEPGKYRYRVTPYSRLDLPRDSSDWKGFDVIPAIKPERYDFSPSVFYVDENTVHELVIATKNVNSDTRISLRRIGGKVIVPEKYINEDDSHVRLFFDNKQLASGDYEIVAINPGGKRTSKEGFTIANVISTPKESSAFYMGVSGMFLGVGQFHDQSFGQYGMRRIHFPSGLSLRFDHALYKGDYFNFLFEMAPSGYVFKASFGDDTILNTLMLNMNFLFQWTFKQKAAFCFRPGFGIGKSLLSNSSEKSNQWLVSAAGNIGFSFQYLAWEHSFLESGIDMSIIITRYQFGYILPWVCLGVKW
jgi:hypothetical protein